MAVQADPFAEFGSRIGAHLDGHLAQSSSGAIVMMLAPNRASLAQIDGKVRLKGKHPVETRSQDLFVVLSERIRHQHYADQTPAQGVQILPECIPIRAAEEGYGPMASRSAVPGRHRSSSHPPDAGSATGVPNSDKASA